MTQRGSMIGGGLPDTEGGHSLAPEAAAELPVVSLGPDSPSPPRAMATPRRGGLARNTLHLILGQVVTTALTIVLSAAVGRSLGIADFGVLYLATTAATFAYVFVDWGHGSYVIREIARHPHRTGEVMGSVMVLRAATALLLIGPAILVGWVLGYGQRTLVFIALMMTAWVPMYLGLTYGWAFRGAERMEFDALVNVILKFLSLVFGLVMLVLGLRVGGLIAAAGLAGTATLIVGTVLYHRLHFPPLHVSRAMMYELITGGAAMMSMTVAVAVQPYIDANLLSRLAPISVMGWHAAAVTFTSTLVAPAGVLSSAAYPRLSTVLGDPVRFSKTLHEAMRPLLFVAMLGAIGTYQFANVPVSIVYGAEKFAPTVDILRAFAPGMFLVFIDMMLGSAIVAAGRAGSVAAAKVFAIVVMSALELILIPICQARFGNGGLGVMAAFAVGEIIMVSADVYLLPRGVLRGGTLLDVGRALIAGAVTFIVMRALPMTPVIGIPFCIVLFTAASYAVGLITRSDFRGLLSMIRRRRAPLADEATPAS